MKKEVHFIWKSTFNSSDQRTDTKLCPTPNRHTVIFQNGSQKYDAKDALLQLIRLHLSSIETPTGARP